MALLKLCGVGVVVVGAWMAWQQIRLGKAIVKSSLGGRRVVVTGASQGIGEALAYAAAESGAHLLLTARNRAALDKGEAMQVAAKCVSLGAPSASVVPADMGEAADVAALAAAIEKEWDGRLDELVLNHALQIPVSEWSGSSKDTDMMRKMLEVNFHSMVELASGALPMLEASSGRLCVVSSIIGKLPMPFFAPYATSKFALQGFFGAVQHELGMRSSKVSVTLGVLGRIATAKQYDITGNAAFVRHGKVVDDSADVEDTAWALLAATERRDREVFFPLRMRAIDILYRLPFVREAADRAIAYLLERDPTA